MAGLTMIFVMFVAHMALVLHFADKRKDQEMEENKTIKKKSAKKHGTDFEQNIKRCTDDCGILFERFKDSNKFSFNQGGATRFTPENPCDCFLYDGELLVYAELKATYSSLSFNQPVMVQEKGKAKPAIKSHQVKELVARSAYNHVMCGLIIEHEDTKTGTKRAFFIEINKFVRWTEQCGKKSINIKDMVQIGIPINAVTRRGRNVYDMKELMDRLKHRIRKA